MRQNQAIISLLILFSIRSLPLTYKVFLFPATLSHYRQYFSDFSFIKSQPFASPSNLYSIRTSRLRLPVAPNHCLVSIPFPLHA